MNRPFILRILALALSIFTLLSCAGVSEETSIESEAPEAIIETFEEEEIVAPPTDEEIAAGLSENATEEIGKPEPTQSREGIAVVSITKNRQKAAVTLDIGAQAQITTNAPEGTPVRAVSKKTNVATVNDALILTAVKEGTATIAVTAGKNKATITVTVVDPYKPTSVSLGAAKVTVNLGKTLRLEPTLAPESAKTTITFTSSKAKVAKVDANGLITALTEGTTKITATTANKKKATITVIVVDPYKPSAISLGAAKITVNLGETLRLEPTLTPESAKTTITFTSSKAKVAKVDANGLIMALTEGTTKITATTANKKKATITVTVVDPYKPTGVSLGAAKQTVNVTDTLQLTPILAPETARTTFRYTSSKPKVAKVDANGLVTALTEGATKVTVTTANNKKATITVTVADPYKPSNVQLTDAKVTIGLDETYQLTPILTPDTARTTFSYASSKPKIAKVDANGLVTPVKVGATTITVTTANKKKATVAVTVVTTTKPSSVAITGSGEVYLATGGERKLRATVLPDTARQELVWTSSNEEVAIVDGVGTVTARAIGTAVVTATAVNGKSASVTVFVLPEDDEHLALPLTGVVIGIDPGHQRRQNTGQEPIAPGSSKTKKKVSSGCAGVKTRIAEYVVNLEVGLQLRDALEELGATVVMTRTTHDVNISNKERAMMMNEAGCDVWLRIHCNSANSSDANGIGMYVSKTYGVPKESYRAGEALLDAMVEATGARRRSVYWRDSYTGNNWSKVPCVLVEMGYMSNPREDALLTSPAYQAKLVTGMVNGIRAFVGR